jgi:hypothetical protein
MGNFVSISILYKPVNESSEPYHDSIAEAINKNHYTTLKDK